MRRLFVVVVVAMAGLYLPAVPARATAVASITSCGQVVTTDAVLRTDLVCAGDALTIEASNVTVRLDGHTISSSDGLGGGVKVGVATSTETICVDHVALHGGTVSGFLDGVVVACGTTTDDISRLTLTDNTWGVVGECYEPLTLDRITIVGPNGIGSGSRTDHCAPRLTVSRSTIDVTDPSGVSVGASMDWNSSGIVDSRLSGGGIDVTSANFTISNSRLSGVNMGCGDGNLTVVGSHLVDTVLSYALACGEVFDGDQVLGPGSGTAIDMQTDHYAAQVTNSLFSGWDTAVALDGADAALITGNTFRDNGSGVAVCASKDCGGAGTISDNRFVDNTGTGLLLSAGTWHLGSNVALRNGGLGIDAEGSTVIDDGGNVARHNQPPQCIGVVCAR
jgi:hypothetical protein